MKKRITALLLAFVLVVTLSGCIQDKPLPTDTPTVPTASPTETYTEPTTQPTETEPPETVPELPAVTELSCYAEESYPGMMALGNGKILLVNPMYNVDDEGTPTEYTNVSIVDYYADTVYTQRFEGSLSIPERLYENGEILLRDFTDNLYIWVDEELNLIDTLPMDLNGYFSKDLSVYYFTKGGDLYGKDMATGQETRIDFQWDLPFYDGLNAVHPDKDLFIANVRRDAFSWDVCMAVLRPEDGTIVALPDFNTDYSPRLWGDGIYTTHYQWESEYGNEYIYGSLEGTEDMNHVPLSVFGDENISTWFIQNTNYMVSSPFDGVTSTLWRVGDEISRCKLEEMGCSRYVSDCIALPDGYLAGIFYEEGSGNRLMILNPEVMTFETVCQADKMERPNMLDAELAQACIDGQKPAEVRPDMAEARALADEMEEEFGVTILISNQCEILQNDKVQSSYDVWTTDMEGFDSEPDKVKEGLGYIRDALNQYPAGFFEQFKEGTSSKGVLIALTGRIDEWAYNGFEMQASGWYLTAVSIYGPEVTSVTAHELWHATEERVSNAGVSINSDAWNACNPEGFAYDFGQSGTAAEFMATGDWTYLDGDWWVEPGDRNPEDWYFVRAYSKYNDREDRATIMELIMPLYKSEEAAQFMSSSHVQQKLALMSEALRSAFDTTGWENVYWEQFLN